MKRAFSKEMQNMDAAGLLRSETAVVQLGNMEAHIDGGKRFLNFVGNDLLGWHTNEIIRETAKQALSQYGTGSTSSRVTVGTVDVHKTLEEKLSEFFGIEDCIIFPSNYTANIGLFEPLTSQRDTIFMDEMCNPGLIDGARLSTAKIVTYKHNDNKNLEYHLKSSQNTRFRIVATDGVFNTNGDCAKLDRIQRLKEVYDAITIVDDSFGIGILGKNGKGTHNYLKLERISDLLTGSFAFALGNVSGGFVGGDKELVKWLRHTSRSYILSEPISPINAAIVLKVIEILQDDQSIIEKLYANLQYTKVKLIKKGWMPFHNEHPFISIVVGSTLNAQKVVDNLFEKNILVSGLCYPNTPEGKSLIRINLSSNHTEEHIDRLIDALKKALRHVK